MPLYGGYVTVKKTLATALAILVVLAALSCRKQDPQKTEQKTAEEAGWVVVEQTKEAEIHVQKTSISKREQGIVEARVRSRYFVPTAAGVVYADSLMQFDCGKGRSRLLGDKQILKSGEKKTETFGEKAAWEEAAANSPARKRIEAICGLALK
jgi:hypothetical protein